jgi:hypothetical protein
VTKTSTPASSAFRSRAPFNTPRQPAPATVMTSCPGSSRARSRGRHLVQENAPAADRLLVAHAARGTPERNASVACSRKATA